MVNVLAASANASRAGKVLIARKIHAPTIALAAVHVKLACAPATRAGMELHVTQTPVRTIAAVMACVLRVLVSATNFGKALRVRKTRVSTIAIRHVAHAIRASALANTALVVMIAAKTLAQVNWMALAVTVMGTVLTVIAFATRDGRALSVKRILAQITAAAMASVRPGSASAPLAGQAPPAQRTPVQTTAQATASGHSIPVGASVIATRVGRMAIVGATPARMNTAISKAHVKRASASATLAIVVLRVRRPCATQIVLEMGSV
jgi:hypothetical protein